MANNEMKQNQAKENTQAKKTTTRAKKKTLIPAEQEEVIKQCPQKQKANVNCGVPIVYVDVRFVFFQWESVFLNLRTHAFENTSA